MWLFWTIFVIISIKLFNKLTSGKCYADTVMSGKVVVVTGASGGIGFETAMDLARRGAKVIIACRSSEKGERAARTISKTTKNNSVRFVHLDLTSLASVRQFCTELKSSEVKLDVLVNNAGAICRKRERTADGLLKDMQINYFGPFLLTILLVPMLKRAAPSRVIVVSSAWHKLGRVDGIDDETTGFMQAYANSKLCNVLFSKELARRLKDTGVVVNSLNPGQVNTSLNRSSIMLDKLRSIVLYFFFKTPAEGAQTSIHMAVSDDFYTVSGKYFEDCREVSPTAKAEDDVSAGKLWAISEKLVGLKADELAEVNDLR